MENILGEKLVVNGNIISTSELTHEIIYSKNSIYEVLRVVNSVPLFLEDHLERLKQSKQLVGFKCNYSIESVKTDVVSYINAIKLKLGNIRIEIRSNRENCNVLIFQVKHSYPDPRLYKSGIALKCYHVERTNPNIKQSVVNNTIRNKIKDILTDKTIYEVLLINHLEEITEGSKSNILFVSGTTLFSPPHQQILEGITRKHILYLSEKLGYEVVERSISYSKLNNFEACFITGTSPKILPVYKIENTNFNVTHPVIESLMKEYNQHIYLYCKNFNV